MSTKKVADLVTGDRVHGLGKVTKVEKAIEESVHEFCVTFENGGTREYKKGETVKLYKINPDQQPRLSIL